MKKALFKACALCVGATAVQAGGLDRSGQGVNILFEEGSVAQFRLGYTNPSVSGSMEDRITGSPTFGETIDSGNVANDFFTPHLAYKTSLTERLDFALVYDQPFGADIDYSADYPLSQNVLSGFPGGSTDVLRAKADTDAVTALLRYKLDSGFSVIGGVRAQRLKASVSVPIAGAGTTPPQGGYRVETDDEIDFGYVVGVAWERPDIAARVALTYNSKITHDLSQTEANDFINGFIPPGIPTIGRTSADSTTEVVTPQSVNLDFQTGVAPKTLLFGSVRWVDWPQTVYAPPVYEGLTGINLVDYEEATWTYSLGLGYQFSEQFSGAVTLGYESSQGNSVSNLGPTDGFWSIGLGGTYSFEKAQLSGGVRYTDIGDATANGTGPDNRATFTGNSAWSVGFQITYSLD